MIDLLYLTHNRLEFTKASLAALLENTEWGLVRDFIVYDDDSQQDVMEYLKQVESPHEMKIKCVRFSSPVSVMNDYLATRDPRDGRIFGKIDSDTMVPPGWLSECLKVMENHRKLDLLGIEAFNEVVPGQLVNRTYSRTNYIGGIGLMRCSAFVTLPRPDGRFGFTAWQDRSNGVVKGWLNPSLPVFLLDRIPREPWISLTQRYVDLGWQRHWPKYEEKFKILWSWWCE